MKTSITIVVMLLLFVNKTSFGQVLPDDKLYEMGYNELQKRNWPAASAYLFAFIQRNPIDFIKDKGYEQQVKNAYDASIKNIENDKQSMVAEIARQNTYIEDLKRRLKIATSSSSGIIVLPPIPPLKQPRKQSAQRIKTRATGMEKPLPGEWRATLTSSTGSAFSGILLIVTNEEVVSGTLTLSDQSDNKITGMFDGQNLVLMRNTGLRTIQTYMLKKIGPDHYSGTYKNEGDSADNGRIEMVR